MALLSVMSLMVGTIFNLVKVNSFLHVCRRSLSFGQFSDIESITDACSQHFVSDIEHIGNNKQCQNVNYHLNKLLSAATCFFLS